MKFYLAVALWTCTRAINLDFGWSAIVNWTEEQLGLAKQSSAAFADGLQLSQQADDVALEMAVITTINFSEGAPNNKIMGYNNGCTGSLTQAS